MKNAATLDLASLASLPLPHERLDVFKVAIELVAWTTNLPPRGIADLKDQLRRASASVALNIGEGSGKRGSDRARFYEIARGSALECAAAIMVLSAMKAIPPERVSEGRVLCQRLYAMLNKMIPARFVAG